MNFQVSGETMICLVICTGVTGFPYDGKQSDSSLTVAQIMNSLLQNSDFLWRKQGKRLGPSGMT